MTIHSLLNYIGHKSKIVDTIFANLPPAVTGTFYDMFAGSCVVGLNAPYSKVVCVERNPFLSKLYADIGNPLLITEIKRLISQYNLTDSSVTPRKQLLQNPNIGTCQWHGVTVPNMHLDQLNKAGYIQLLQDFNKNSFTGVTTSAAYLIATVYGRNSSVATNLQTLQLSGAVGPLDFSPTCSKKLKEHEVMIAQGRHSFINSDYSAITPTADDFCYFDPPYLASGYTYGGWTLQDEQNLLNYIDSLPCAWALSNTFISGTKSNSLLQQWAANKHVVYINKNYRKWAGAGAQSAKKSNKTNVEVLILPRPFVQASGSIAEELFEFV